VHEDVIDRHRARMTQADALMRRRGALAEHHPRPGFSRRP
jgi:hypothetical protein